MCGQEAKTQGQGVNRELQELSEKYGTLLAEHVALREKLVESEASHGEMRQIIADYLEQHNQALANLDIADVDDPRPCPCAICVRARWEVGT